MFYQSQEAFQRQDSSLHEDGVSLWSMGDGTETGWTVLSLQPAYRPPVLKRELNTSKKTRNTGGSFRDMAALENDYCTIVFIDTCLWHASGSYRIFAFKKYIYLLAHFSCKGHIII